MSVMRAMGPWAGGGRGLMLLMPACGDERGVRVNVSYALPMGPGPLLPGYYSRLIPPVSLLDNTFVRDRNHTF